MNLRREAQASVRLDDCTCSPGVHLSIPYPPSTNNFYAVVRGRKITTKAGREWIEAAIAAIHEQVCGHPFRGPVKVMGYIYRPQRSGDLSNRIKPVEDVLQKAGVLENDSQIDELHWYKRDDKLRPRVEIEIEALP